MALISLGYDEMMRLNNSIKLSVMIWKILPSKFRQAVSAKRAYHMSKNSD